MEEEEEEDDADDDDEVVAVVVVVWLDDDEGVGMVVVDVAFVDDDDDDDGGDGVYDKKLTARSVPHITQYSIPKLFSNAHVVHIHVVWRNRWGWYRDADDDDDVGAAWFDVDDVWFDEDEDACVVVGEEKVI